MIATWKPSGSSGLPLVQSTVQGKGLKAINSRRDSNSRSPISSLVARFMSWRRRGIGGSSGIPGAAFSVQPGSGLGDEQLALVVVEFQHSRQRLDLGIIGVVEQRHPHRVQIGQLHCSSYELGIHTRKFGRAKLDFFSPQRGV